MKPPATRIIGIGQPNAGDDGIGIAVARALRTQALPAGVEVHEITDPARLVELLEGIGHAILVDALVNDATPGEVRCLSVEDLAACTSTPLSSHGTSVAAAIGLLRALTPTTPGCEIRIVGISIAPPQPCTRTLSTPVAAALPRAASMVIDMLEGRQTPPGP